MRIAGVMSGSSLDGVDVALVDFHSIQNWEVVGHYLIPYSDAWIDRLRSYHTLSARAYVELRYAYSYYLADLLRSVIDSDAGIDLLSVHGHTLIHDPIAGYSEQIGNGAILSARTGIPTVTDFRNGDIALGGQGTPLAPAADTMLFGGYDYYLNLGGIANITKVSGDHIVAYDICPCNQVLNHFSQALGQAYDAGGQFARSGSIDPALISYLEDEAYFRQPPPKSLDNNWIVQRFIPDMPPARAVDTLHTFVTWMTNQIASQIDKDHLGTGRLLCTGGGAHNTFLIEMLTAALKGVGCHLHVPNAEIVDYKEAILMALMGYLYSTNQASILSTVTGADRNSIGGALYKV